MIRMIAALLLFLGTACACADTSQSIKIAIDAEFGIPSSTSAQAVSNGAQVAVNEINDAGGVLGRKLEIIQKDNRALPARGINNLRELAADPNVVAVLCGKYSPVVVEMLPEIHRLRIPLLDPWAAADPIIENQYSPSFVFRLSLRDTLAVQAMMHHAAGRGFQRIGLLLANTEWGRSTQRAAESSVGSIQGQRIVAVEWYNWGDKSLVTQYETIRNAGAQAILLVANEVEGAILVNELAAMPKERRLPILSHWGITGGTVFELTKGAISQIDLSVVQTFSFVNRSDATVRRVLHGLKNVTGNDDSRKIASPVGVAHAYDLIHLLARAIKKAGSTDREAVRDALERLGPYVGLTRRFNHPFSSKRHDALFLEDVFMARYAADGALEPVVRAKPVAIIRLP
jgi:branched-chain amino acid transport system substrate-binding protein